LVKAKIVEKYFTAWASIIINTQKVYPQRPQKIAYIDLFAGPGRYENGSSSTPLLVLNAAINNEDFRNRLVTIFNDKNSDHSNNLKKAISELPGIEKLKYQPQIQNEEVGEKIVKMFETMNLVPTLFFVDPWGYKGLSLRLVNSVLKDWGCDCIFFFNYNRINMGVPNQSVYEHICALFGESRVVELMSELNGLSSKERELLIIEKLCQAIKGYGNRYVLPFRFKNSNGNRTTHHLIFVSKHPKGYEIMKEIMAKESSGEDEGVPSFEYNPADYWPRQTLLFKLTQPLEDLREMLLNNFKGQTLTTRDIYNKHNIDTPYILKNYKNVLIKMFEDSIIFAKSANGSPPKKGTMADNIFITFP
jgi:three-Cys-motif partner protein